MSTHTWNHIYQPSVKTIITFRFLRASSTLSFGSRERHKLKDFPHKYPAASGVPERQTATGSPPSPGPAIPCWARAKQQLEKRTCESPLRSQGDPRLCWQRTTLTFAQHTSRCESGFVGHELTLTPLVLKRAIWSETQEANLLQN